MRVIVSLARVTFVHAALGCLAAWSLWAQFIYRVPDRFLSVALAAVTVAGLGATLLSWIALIFNGLAAAPQHRRFVDHLYRACALAILSFCFYSLYLFTNGKFDLSDPVPHAASVVSIAQDEGALGAATPLTWMTLTSWRDRSRTERLLIRWDERTRLWPGQPVVVLERSGFYGTRWVSAVEPNVEEQSRDILRLAPTALQIWKNLAWFYVRLLRFDDARRAASTYIGQAPDDAEFPAQIASAMMGRDRFVEIAAVLQPVVQGHERADIWAAYGYAVAMQGNREGLKYLERAAALEPQNWWPHYGLGHAYSMHGDYPRAIASFERALQLRPGLADAMERLTALRQRAAQKRR